ncbi:hypothetical protein AX16_002939 [Volvariella volvacea WC 439]|nr:hypothetical protein AX16_002939 [Volvariella volvacea WC 439]
MSTVASIGELATLNTVFWPAAISKDWQPSECEVQPPRLAPTNTASGSGSDVDTSPADDSAGVQHRSISGPGKTRIDRVLDVLSRLCNSGAPDEAFSVALTYDSQSTPILHVIYRADALIDVNIHLTGILDKLKTLTTDSDEDRQHIIRQELWLQCLMHGFDKWKNQFDQRGLMSVVQPYTEFRSLSHENRESIKTLFQELLEVERLLLEFNSGPSDSIKLAACKALSVAADNWRASNNDLKDYILERELNRTFKVFDDVQRLIELVQSQSAKQVFKQCSLACVPISSITSIPCVVPIRVEVISGLINDVFPKGKVTLADFFEILKVNHPKVGVDDTDVLEINLDKQFIHSKCALISYIANVDLPLETQDQLYVASLECASCFLCNTYAQIYNECVRGTMRPLIPIPPKESRNDADYLWIFPSLTGGDDQKTTSLNERIEIAMRARLLNVLQEIGQLWLMWYQALDDDDSD